MFNIYKLTCNKTGQDYYGSTEVTIKTRLQGHKKDYNLYLKGTRKDYCTSFEIIKNNDYEIELLETCNNKNRMREREAYYIKSFLCVNKNIPGRTRKEYYQDNREKILEERKEYYEDNREKILEHQKELFLCACGSTLTIHGKARHERTIKHKRYLGIFV